MKKLHTYIYLLCASVSIFIGCNKPIDGYNNDPRIYFFERTNDGFQINLRYKTYSFLLKPASVTQDTIYIKSKIMGLPSDGDRTFTVKVDTGTTAAATDFKILPGVVKAGEITGQLPIVMYRTPELKTSIKKLNIIMVSGSDFKVGINDDHDIVFGISWTDDLIQPGNWETSLKNYFGTYSRTKFQFIVDVLKRDEFPVLTYGAPYVPGVTLTPYQMYDLVAMLREALLTYNNTHPTPLADENGPITF